MVPDRRAGTVKGRAVTLPAIIVDKASVPCARRRIIISDFAHRVKDVRGSRRSVYREVAVGPREGRTRVARSVERKDPDVEDADRHPGRTRTATLGGRKRGGSLKAHEYCPLHGG